MLTLRSWIPVAGWILAALAALGARGAAALECESADFVQAPTYPVHPLPIASTAGDFDGDGALDIATASDSDLAVSVNLGDGAGGFGLPIEAGTVSGYPVSIASGYLDAGDTLDLVVGADLQVFVLLGNGDGTFQPPVTYDGAEYPSSFVLADLSGDGIPDLIEGSGFRQNFAVLQGLGDGTFGPPQTYFAATGAIGITVADLDEDDLPDVAITTNDNRIDVYFGLGGGALAPPVHLKVGGALGPVVAADLDGDEHLDLATRTGPYLATLHGHGDGTFDAAVVFPVFAYIYQLAAADLNADGRTDLLGFASSDPFNGPGIVAPILQTADGRFTVVPRFRGGIGSVGMALGDFDGDSLLDAVLVNRDTGSAATLLGQGDGTFRAGVSLPTTGEAIRLAQADFIGEGRPQLAVLSASREVNIYQASGGQASPVGDIRLADFANDFVADDFDGDGQADLAVVEGTPALEIFLGHGDGTFNPPQSYPLPEFVEAVAAGDFTGDGRPDLAVVSPYPATLSILLNDGSGAFVAGQELSVNAGGSILAARLDPGPTVDLAMTNLGGHHVLVALGAGDGTFGDPTPYATGPQPVDLAAGQFTADQALDLVVANGGDTTISLLVSDGSGGFAAPVSFDIGVTPASITVGDFNHDGFLDTATGNSNFSYTASVLHGDGAGSFEAPVSFPTGISPIAVAAFPAGGLAPDLALANANSREVEILVNVALTVTPLPDVSPVVGSRVTLTAVASGFGVTFQWRKGGVPLTDGGTISGATTTRLTVDPVSFDDAGSYDVVVTDACGEVTSNAATLSVEFADVPGSSPFHDDIITIATEGITGGCGGGNYCPTSPVRRDQMAAFLLKSEHGSAYNPPNCTGVFDDVICPGPFTNWVEQLAGEGITGGCGVDIYCPDQSVTRAQMALFLLKTKEGSGYTPPPATGIFGDVPPGSFGADFIEELYHRGITGGCSASPLLYCPGNAVLRQQMATLLVRTFAP